MFLFIWKIPPDVKLRKKRFQQKRSGWQCIGWGKSKGGATGGFKYYLLAIQQRKFGLLKAKLILKRNWKLDLSKNVFILYTFWNFKSIVIYLYFLTFCNNLYIANEGGFKKKKIVHTLDKCVSFILLHNYMSN